MASRAAEWAESRKANEASRPEQFVSAPSDLGNIVARVEDSGGLFVSVNRYPPAFVWVEFARWILATFADPGEGRDG